MNEVYTNERSTSRNSPATRHNAGAASPKRMRTEIASGVHQEPLPPTHQPHQACFTCKKRKIRCDSRRPKCTHCISKGKDCSYPPIYTRAVCSQSHVDYLEFRVNELENIQSQIHAQSNFGQHSIDIDKFNNREQNNTFRRRVSDDGGNNEPAVNDEHPVVIHHTRSSIPEPSEGSPGTYLTSSTQSCIRFPGEFCNTGIYLSTVQSSDMLESGEDHGGLRPYLSSTTFNSLPVQHIAITLLESYFQTIHPIWPIVDEAFVRSQFHQTWSSGQMQHPLWIAQLNLIFSLGCQAYEKKPGEDAPLSSIYQAGEDFYQRAQIYVTVKAFAFSSVGLLQGLLLMALYQQSVFRPNPCWLTIGHASRMAHGLGLHLEVPRSSRLPRLDRELRKRLWWACFCLDRTSAMIFNRPAVTSHSMNKAGSRNLLQMIKDLDGQTGGDHSHQLQSTSAFFLHTTKLCYIVDEISESLANACVTNAEYTDLDRGRSGENDIPGSRLLSYLMRVNHLDRTLLGWRDSLPSHLRFNPGEKSREDTVPAPVHRQRNVLHTRFLWLRTLLHRQSLLYLLQRSESRPMPILPPNQWRPLFSQSSIESDLSAHCKNSTPSPLETAAAQLNAGLFVSSARQLLDVLSLTDGHAGGWWFDFHFTAMSACGILGAMALASQDLQAVVPNIGNIKLLLKASFKLIRRFHEYNKGKSDRTLKYLEEWSKFIGFDVDIAREEAVMDSQDINESMQYTTTLSYPPNLRQESWDGAVPPEFDASSSSFDFDRSDVLDPRNLLLNPGGDDFWSNANSNIQESPYSRY